MRYADKVVLKYNDNTKQHYDPALGRMIGGKEQTKTVSCNVTGASLELQAKLGELLNTNSIVIRLRSPITVAIDTIEYEGHQYKPVTTRSYPSGRYTIYANRVVS